MISWSYLDKKDATIRAMKDYDAMKFIIENTSDEIKQISEKMTSVGVPKYDDHVRSGNVHAGEDSVINRLEEINTLKERYRQALEYMAWFEPAWAQLSDEEQYILESVYVDELPRMSICSHIGWEKDAYYRRRNNALSHLATLLYGVM